MRLLPLLWKITENASVAVDLNFNIQTQARLNRAVFVGDLYMTYADLKEYLNQKAYIVIDRPLGSVHPKHSDIVYPVNYGYIPNTISGDGEEIDVYLLGVSVPVRDFNCRIIAVIERLDDNENKLVAVPEGVTFTAEEIKSLTYFQEKYFNTRIITEV